MQKQKYSRISNKRNKTSKKKVVFSRIRKEDRQEIAKVITARFGRALERLGER